MSSPEARRRARIRRRKRRRRIRVFLRLALIVLLAAIAVFAYHLYKQRNTSEEESILTVTPQSVITVQEESEPDALETEETAEEEPETIVEETVDASGFYYAQLNEEQQRIYTKLLNGCENFESSVSLGNVSRDDWRIAETALAYDRPEFYWLSETHTYYSSNNGSVSRVEYDLTDAWNTQTRLAEAADEIIAGIAGDATTYQKIRYYYETIINTTAYDSEAAESGDVGEMQDARSVFFDHLSVCAGYAQAFKYLCDRSGIECVYVTGTAVSGVRTGNHAWNLVKIDDQWYWVDVTWGEAAFEEDSTEAMNYNYLCVTDSDLYTTHTIDDSLMLAWSGIDFSVEYPSCTDDSYDYYVLTNARFDSFDPASYESFFERMYRIDPTASISCKFTNDEAYRQAIEVLLNQDQIFNILHDLEPLKQSLQIQAAQNDPIRVLVIKEAAGE